MVVHGVPADAAAGFAGESSTRRDDLAILDMVARTDPGLVPSPT
jgi:hypothetical protein